MKNKGFTLVELLATITVLGLILIIAVPKITDVLEISKKNSFLGEAQSIYRAADVKIVSDEVTGIIYSKGENKLNLDGNKLDYCVIVNDEGDITSITVSNGTYIISGGKDFMSLTTNNVTNGNMNSFVCE